MVDRRFTGRYQKTIGGKDLGRRLHFQLIGICGMIANSTTASALSKLNRLDCRTFERRSMYDNTSINWKSSFPPILLHQDNPASMDFIEGMMLAQLLAQDAIRGNEDSKILPMSINIARRTLTLQWETWLCIERISADVL
jgi:hypothetical protein